jgi:hypothetical protein
MSRRPVIGQQNRRIQLQTAAVVQTPSGETILDWAHATTETVNAAWLPAGTVETAITEAHVRSFIEGVYRIGWREPGPAPENTRIVGHRGHLYDLKPPIEIGYRAGWDLPVVSHGETP